MKIGYKIIPQADRELQKKSGKGYDEGMPELRQDPLSGDWIILSPGRAKRPNMLDRAPKKKRQAAPKKDCPFENLQKSGNGTVIQAWPSAKKWKIAVIPNKYPALVHGEACAIDFKKGIYSAAAGFGEHELIVTRDHNTTFADLDLGTATKVLEMFQDRYRAVNDGCNAYAVAFLNYGPSVGASLWHPHYQILAVPFTPPHVERSVRGARDYFEKTGHCLRCEIMRSEIKYKKRIVDEDRNAIAIAPYASKRPFEVSVMARKHFPKFEETPAPVIRSVAQIMQRTLRRLRTRAGDPDLNFFIHTAPFSKNGHQYHHWHAEILPNMSYLGGLEFATGIYINIVDPDEAAKILKG
jgi:UDPglucose--hexose-1-phosphate uridylyltransferase